MPELVIIGAESQYVRNELHRQRREAQVVDRCLSKRRLGGHIARTHTPQASSARRAREGTSKSEQERDGTAMRSSLMKFTMSWNGENSVQKDAVE